MVAKVTTMEGIFNLVISRPFAAPSSAPSASTSNPTNGIGRPALANNPVAILAAANCEPTEISI